MSKFVLASASPRRREILDTIGIKYTVKVSDYDESTTPAGLSPEELVKFNAVCKGKAVADELRGTDAVVISCDTVVTMPDQDGDRVLGKPVDEQDAIETLSMLSGNTHRVYTGLAITFADTGESICCVDQADVTFNVMSSEEIVWYVSTGEPMDKAGSYGIQGIGARYIKGLNGNYHTVMGLPSSMLYGMLRNRGLL